MILRVLYLYLGLFTCSLMQAQNLTISSKLIAEPPTLLCLGFEWHIEGDDNRNAFVLVRYREKGEPLWNEGMPLLRIGNEKAGTPGWNFVTPNLFAGSIIDLKPGTAYECRLELSDPDGTEGETSVTLTLSTRNEPKLPVGGNIRHVYPENWKSEKQQPAYNGLLHAYFGYPRYADWILTTDPVKPGDIILVHAGVYKADYKNYRDYHGLTFDGTYALTVDGTEEKPVVIKAAGDGDVVFDGNGCARLFDVTAADNHYFEGITFRNTETAICAGTMNINGCKELIVKNCQFENIGIGIQAQFEGCRNFYIADNTFTGREDTSKVYHHKIENGKNVQRIASYYAVKVHGQGHTICYNRIRYFFDGIDICTHAVPETDQEKKAVAIDIYNNDIFLCNDNFIEADGGNHNIRVLRNRCFNSGQQALSNQPVLGGPVYWIRNIVYNCGNASTFKFWGMFPAGVVIYHNTSSGIFTRDDKPGSNIHSRNNLFLPSNNASLPTLGLYTNTSYSSLDYNGYRKREPFIGYYAPDKGQLADFSNDKKAVRYNSLQEFSRATGQEIQGIEVDYNIFEKVSPPEFASFSRLHQSLGETYPVYYPHDFNFSLKNKAVAIDAGCKIPGVNSNFAGKAPDLGAFEFGLPLPHYGPRHSLNEPVLDKKNNSLTEAEKAEGSKLLSDVSVAKGWRGYKKDSITSNWDANNGELKADVTKGDSLQGQIRFEYETVSHESGFKMDGYWVWCGSMVKVGSTYHLFASRWPKTGEFPDGYRQNSEIVRATSDNPLGPFKFEEVVIGERDSIYWDSNMSHNPTIHKIGNEYVLFYIGSDFSTRLPQSKQLLRRVGYATSKSITGPWERSPEPVIDVESNNPAILVERDKVLLVFRDAPLRVYLAEATSYKGPFTLINDNVWPGNKIEDFYMFKAQKEYHIICEDNVGGISGHERWGVHLATGNPKAGWRKYDPVIVYDHEIAMDSGSVLHCVRRERPQLLIENGEITHLVTSVYDGKNTWSQPVKLKKTIKVDH